MEARRWPGKYRASGPNKYGDVYVTTDLAGEGMHLVIAEMRIPDPQDLIGNDGGPVAVETSCAMAVKTAKMFAAAPDLLSIVERLYELNARGVLRIPDEHYRLITNAADALAKARGQ